MQVAKWRVVSKVEGADPDTNENENGKNPEEILRKNPEANENEKRKNGSDDRFKYFYCF